MADCARGIERTRELRRTESVAERGDDADVPRIVRRANRVARDGVDAGDWRGLPEAR